MRAITASLLGDVGNDVPCGTCVGCCSSFWPIALRRTDAAVIPLIPIEHLIDPPNAPSGLRYMGYEADGTCPMLKAERCTVYDLRPQTCRDFDCRLFTAAGLSSAGADKALINARIAAWQFSYATDDDRATHEAIKSAATFILGPARALTSIRVPSSPIAIAGLAFKAHRVFKTDQYRERASSDVWADMISAARAFDEALHPDSAPTTADRPT